jgi:hypothetical protein
MWIDRRQLKEAWVSNGHQTIISLDSWVLVKKATCLFLSLPIMMFNKNINWPISKDNKV